MRVLVGCEFSGIVRDAFRAQGHDAVSCDLLPSERSGLHYQGDLFDILDEGWDLLIFHWPCVNMAVSGAKHFYRKRVEQATDVQAFQTLATWSSIPRICGENPVSVLSTQFRKPSQIVHPYWFGHREFKTTCLWLKGLPLLTPSQFIAPPLKGTPEHKQWSRVHREPPGPDRWKNRSRTYTGLATAMATQWGNG